MEDEFRGTVGDHPELYDILHDGYSGDVDLYAHISAGRNPILECGVGTGRVAIPLAKLGKTVHGLDNSAEMLEELRLKLQSEPAAIRRRLLLHQADMRSFALGRTFGFVSVPFMTFNYLLTLDEQLDCLRCIEAHLEPGGYLAMELMSFYREWFHDDGITRVVLSKRDRESGETVQVHRLTRFDPATQIVEHDRTYRFVDVTGKVRLERTVFWRNRFFFLGEAELLLKAVGLELQVVWGGHNREPFTRDSRVAFVVAQKPG